MCQLRRQSRRSYWLKSTARGSPEKKRTDEPQKPGKMCGRSTQPRRSDRRPKKEKGNLQQHRPEKKQNVLRETTEMRTKTTSPQKNQAARTQRMSQPKRSSREPTGKATSKLYFVRNVFSLAGQKLTQYSYLFVDFNPFSYSTDRLFFSTIESSY